MNLEEVFDDVNNLETIEAIQFLIAKGVTPEQYKDIYCESLSMP